ncbi:MAG: FliI/YscN family ATPase, partial [Actinobacteria bacterium]|nr:FliI/YscN family ATPase [Actinomycetota bacterium]
IDAFTPLAAGQRVGVFAGSGVGKSTLLSMMVNGSDADVIVVGLVGERGREVREFIENQLGADGLARSVVVVATGDETALMRVTAAETATAIAEDFRDNGRRVLLVIDSITRFAMAHREIGLAAGELPAARGYPPSTMSVLPQLLERAGNSEFGTMTAIYTVLVDGDDMDEPVADTVRGILDGHIVLSRELANMGHFPAIDVLASVSRLSSVVYTDEQEELVRRARLLLGEFAAARDLIDVGAYVPGSNALIDEAIARRPGLNSFLQQGENEMSDIDRTWLALADALTKEIPS